MPFAGRTAAAPAGARRLPSRSCVSSTAIATISAASHATCVLATRSKVRSWATGALFPRSLLAGVTDTVFGATDGLGAAIGGNATCGFFAWNEEFGSGGT